jgi:ribonuclease VapC
MIVDTSAILAVLLDEPERQDFVEKMARAPTVQLSAGTWIELAAVQVRGNREVRAAMTALMAEFRISIAPVTTAQGMMGHEAYHRYGIGSGHPARLNYGDCFAYALAKETGEALLFKGDDFVHTDVLAA